MKATKGRLVAAALALAAVAWGLDQLTKYVVESRMELGDRIEVIPNFLYWQYHLNPGAAFSMGTDYTWFFTTVMLIVLVVVLHRISKLGGSWLWAIGLGGLAGGVSGNLTDRIFRAPSIEDGNIGSFGQGHVVDMIGVPNFAIFNVADSFIVCSIIGICALMVFGFNIDGSRAGKKESDPDGDAEENELPSTVAAEEPAAGQENGPARSGQSQDPAATTSEDKDHQER